MINAAPRFDNNLLESRRWAYAVVQQRLVHVLDEHHQRALGHGLVDDIEQCVNGRCMCFIDPVCSIFQSQLVWLHIIAVTRLAALVEAAAAVKLEVKTNADQVL